MIKKLIFYEKLKTRRRPDFLIKQNAAQARLIKQNAPQANFCE